MNRQERLADAMVCIVTLICVLFFAFAAGVWYDENHRQEEVPEAEPQAAVIVVEKPTVVVTVEAPKAEAVEPVMEDSFTEPDPMIEDSYLIADHPLSYELQSMLYGACLEFGVEYKLALAVMEQETNFRNVVGDDGKSVGFMQIQKRWWSELMAEIGADDLHDPEDNFRTGCAILRQLLDRYESLEDALSAYNSGKPGSTKYSREVMEKYGT